MSMYGIVSVVSYTTIARYMKRTLIFKYKRISNRLPKILSQYIKAKCSENVKFISICHQSKAKVIQIYEFTIGGETMPKMV